MRRFLIANFVIFSIVMSVLRLPVAGEMRSIHVGKAESSRYALSRSRDTVSSDKEEQENIYLDRIIMTNADRFTGVLKAIKKGIIHIESPLLPGEAEIPLRNAREIHCR